jgi:hypothetical protein
MFVVLVGGYTNQRDRFYDEMDKYDQQIVWINDKRSFYYIADLFVNFGEGASIPLGKKTITWSGNNTETLQRIYKTLGLE